MDYYKPGSTILVSYVTSSLRIISGKEGLMLITISSLITSLEVSSKAIETDMISLIDHCGRLNFSVTIKGP